MASDVGNGLTHVLLGVCIIAWAAMFPFSTFLEVQSHARTTGEVTAIEIEDVDGDDPFGNDTQYVPNVTYEYTVDGETYVGTNVTNPNREELEYDSKAAATDFAANHSNGSTLRVYYRSKQPSWSYIEGPSGSPGLTALGGGLFGLLLTGLGLRQF